MTRNNNAETPKIRADFPLDWEKPRFVEVKSISRMMSGPASLAGSRFLLSFLLIMGVLSARPASAQHNSPVTSSDSVNFTLNTTATTENGGQTKSDSVIFVLNTTGVAGIQSDSGDFTLNTLLSPAVFSLLAPSWQGGNFQFNFTNAPGRTFSVYGSTNLTIPFSNWMLLGTVTDLPPGQYQFTDVYATNFSLRFYRVLLP